MVGMCGIIGYTGNKSALPPIVEGLKALEYRGYDSAGVAFCRAGGIFTVKAVGHIRALEKKLESEVVPETCGIGHTRWSTHGCPTEENSHPHLSFGGKFAVVHNGIIENCRELRVLCANRGIVPKSDTDTELVAHLLESEYRGDPLAALRRTVARLRGSFALGILCADFPNELFAAKRRSPLLIGLADGATCLSSDGAAMPHEITDLIVLADGQTARLSPHGAEVYVGENRTEPEIVHSSYARFAAGLDGYPHYMLKEMCEQPEAIARTVAEECTGKSTRLRSGGVALVGCGSSYHAALACKPLIEQATGCPAEVVLASEFLVSSPVGGRGKQAVFLSQSGETADTIAAAEEAARRGWRTLALSNVRTSTLMRVCDEQFATRAGPEISVATTKGFTTQAAALAALAAARDPSLAAALKELPSAAEKALASAEEVKALAPLFLTAKTPFFIGRKTDYGAALEGALKLKEISYISALGLAAGELKHGSISLIEEGTPVVAICTDPALADKTLLSVDTVRARGGVVIGVTNVAEVAEACDRATLLPPVHPLLSAAVSVIPLQRLAYEVALMLGRDIDKPRNLAKSVTVE